MPPCTRAADRLASAARRGVGCWLPRREAQAVAAHAELWRRRGLTESALRIVEVCALAGLDAHVGASDVAELTLCARCDGYGEWSPPPHDTYPDMCPDCGAGGWAETPPS